MVVTVIRPVAMAEQRKGRKESKADAVPVVEKEDKVKPTLADINAQKNKASFVNFFLPAVLLIYLGLVLSKYNLKEFNHLLTNKYLLLGKRAPPSGATLYN